MLDRSLTPPIDAATPPPIDTGPNKARIAADLQREAEQMVRIRQIQRLQELRLSAQNPKVGFVLFSKTLMVHSHCPRMRTKQIPKPVEIVCIQVGQCKHTINDS